MCTLIVLHRCIPDRPLVVAANRDEFYARPAEDFAIRESRTGPILAPLDLEAGGTWVGLSRRGVFAGLTNLRPLGGLTGALAPRSRGELVMRALEAESAEAAVRETMKRLAVGGTADPADEDASATSGKRRQPLYNPFQLLVADGRDAWLIVYRDGARALELEPGAHIVGNVESEDVAEALGSGSKLDEAGVNGSGPVGAEDPGQSAGLADAGGFEGFEGIEGLSLNEEPRALKLTRIRERVEKMMANPGQDLFEGLAKICRAHLDEDELDTSWTNETDGTNGTRGRGKTERVEAEPVEADGADETAGARAPMARSPFEATCVHVADRYGTRSAMLLELGREDRARGANANRLWTTSGPPCERPFENRSSLLEELGVRLGDR